MSVSMQAQGYHSDLKSGGEFAKMIEGGNEQLRRDIDRLRRVMDRIRGSAPHAVLPDRSSGAVPHQMPLMEAISEQRSLIGELAPLLANLEEFI